MTKTISSIKVYFPNKKQKEECCAKLKEKFGSTSTGFLTLYRFWNLSESMKQNLDQTMEFIKKNEFKLS